MRLQTDWICRYVGHLETHLSPLLAVQFMEQLQLFETQEQTMQRIDILSKLRDLVESWIKLVAAHLGKTEAEIEDAYAVVNTFGSFRLEVHGPGAHSHDPQLVVLLMYTG